jgi:uncharacterized membrane protein required for colicin V production
MIWTAAIAMGFVFAVFGYRRGFYATWAMLFNIAISIYLSVMLTPTAAAFLPAVFPDGAKSSDGSFWYAYAGIAAAVAFVSFVILQVIAMAYFTGAFNISLPKVVDRLGATLIGFAAGYVLWGFICFLVLIMPKSENVFLKTFTATSESKELSMPAVSKVVNTINAVSLQPNREQVKNVISWTLGWEMKEPNRPND